MPGAEDVVIKVRQRHAFDCGVACLAMAAGLTYEQSHAVFVQRNLSLRRGKKSPYATNFQELQGALQACGVPHVRRRYANWPSVHGAAILKVNVQKSGNWHWVFAGRNRAGELYLHDPQSGLPAIERGPMDGLSTGLYAYAPKGCFLDLSV